MNKILFNKYVLAGVAVTTVVALLAAGQTIREVFLQNAETQYRNYTTQITELEIEVKRLQATWAEKQKIVDEAQVKQSEVNALATERNTKIDELKAARDAVGK